MRQISVLTQPSYEVRIERGLMGRLPFLADGKGDRKLFLLTDRNVQACLCEQVESLVKIADGVYVTEPGEGAKSLAVFGEVLEAMAEARLDRGDLLLALGGGVTGDLGGFCAASYLRGIEFHQIPTTLLAAVDSSVGGKTAINLRSGKNLCGAFHQPGAVWIDPDGFATLPPERWTDGIAEMIKTGVLFDKTLFERLCRPLHPDDPDLDDLLAVCIGHKARVVTEDEKERGSRQLLNLGHTFGHAIEAGSGYQIPHGRAVAAGIGMITRAGHKRGFCDRKTVRRMEKALAAHGLPTGTEAPPSELLPYILRDKKARGKTLTLIVPTAIGQAEKVKVPVGEIAQWLEDSYDYD